MALLVDPYLLLGLCLVNVLDAVGSRVGHLGILVIRVAIGFRGSSRCGLSFLNELPIVPDMVNKEGAGWMIQSTHSRSALNSSPLKASSSRLPDLWML